MPHEMSNQRVYLLLMSVMTIWGLNLVLVKMLTGYFEAVFMCALRMGIAFIFLSIITWQRFGTIPRVSRRQLTLLAGAGFLVVYAHQVTFALGLQWSTATNGGLILAINPLLSVFLASLFYQEQLTPTRMAGVLLGLAGVAIVILAKSNAELRLTGTGDIVLVGSMLCFVFGGMCVRKIAGQLPPLVICWYMYLFGAVLLLAHAAFTPAFFQLQGWFPDAFSWGLLLLSAIGASAIGNVFWNHSIARLGLARTTLFLNWVPITSAFFGMTMLNEPVRIAHAIGFICVLSGTYLGVRTVSNKRLTIKGNENETVGS